MLEPSDRRERKKQRTRELIQEAALDLFAASGYHETTIKAIADAADVAPRTVTLHFPAKEDLLFGEDPFAPASLAARVNSRAPGESTFDALRDWMVTTMKRVGDGASEESQRFWRQRALRSRLIANDDALRGRARASYLQAEQVLAAGIGSDLGLPATALVPRLAALAAVAGLRELYETDEAQSVGPTPRADGLIPLVDRVINFVRAGIDALRDDHP
ncbi:MAG: transcriptional regulator, TetR family [Actinomycetia bacterium]|nr:transcriptional regulator, TetR family [Actinomycetes bacterium]